MTSTGDRYGRDVLATDWRAPARRRSSDLVIELGLVLEDPISGFCGAVVATERDSFTLEDRFGRRAAYPFGPGFLHEGTPVNATRPPSGPLTPPGRERTASGSVAVPDAPARLARASRIYVEGRHDAELVEKVWGADLRVEGVTVESLDGVDDLPAIVAEFEPRADRRLGVLVDHLVDGSKEARVATEVMTRPAGAHILVVGHPYVDIWQAVRPDRLGLQAWPEVPRSRDWKHGVCTVLGWPHADQADLARAWRRILGVVRDYRDLEPALLGRVEELIDFVTTTPNDD